MKSDLRILKCLDKKKILKFDWYVQQKSRLNKHIDKNTTHIFSFLSGGITKIGEKMIGDALGWRRKWTAAEKGGLRDVFVTERFEFSEKIGGERRVNGFWKRCLRGNLSPDNFARQRSLITYPHPSSESTETIQERGGPPPRVGAFPPAPYFSSHTPAWEKLAPILLSRAKHAILLLPSLPPKLAPQSKPTNQWPFFFGPQMCHSGPLTWAHGPNIPSPRPTAPTPEGGG